MEFIDKMCKTSNRDHNPFKSVITRLKFFLKQNNVSAFDLLRRLSQNTQADAIPNLGPSVSVNSFASFLRQKVDKKRSLEDLQKYAKMLDVDKDSRITEADINTCIANLNNLSFYRNGGAVLAHTTFNTV